MRKYMAERRARRRRDLIALLGGACVRCGTADDLDFDHIDATTCSFRVSGRGLDKPWAVLLEEVAKCQLLCGPHHWEKTLSAGEVETVDHGGGVSGKRNCPCKPCKDKKAEYMQAYGHPSRVAQLAVSIRLLTGRLGVRVSPREPWYGSADAVSGQRRDYAPLPVPLMHL